MMWLMLTTGALSIVERDPKHTAESEDPTRTLVVRARRQEWLEEFRDRYCPALGEIYHSTDKDYQYRAVLSPDDMAEAAGRAVRDIAYYNFKSATQSPEFGLKAAGQRTSLHGAYSKCWNALLDAGDGTSIYDLGWSGSSYLTGIEACRRWGHWWPVGTEKCKDCGEPNPSYPEAGPDKVFPPDEAPKKKARKRRKKSRQQSAKASIKPIPLDEYCPGTWVEPQEGIAGTVTGTGTCSWCGTKQELTPGGYIRTHHESVEGAA